MFCPNCGSKIEDGSKFCESCGFKLNQLNNSIENNKKQITDTITKNDTQTSKKVIRKSKFSVFLIAFIIFVIGIFGLLYFALKENPINYLMDKTSNGQFILFGSKSNERNLSDRINETKGVAVNGNAQKNDGLVDSNDISVLGDNVHIEGADVYQNSDGSIQIGGTPQEGAKLIQGNDNNSDKLNYFEEELEQTNYFDKNTTIENEEIILNNADFGINKEIYAIGWDSVPNGYAIGLPLNDIGSDKYKKATEKNLGRYLYVIYRDNIVSSIFVDNIYDGSNIVFKVVDGIIGKKIVDEINNKHCEIKIVEGDLKTKMERNTE